MHDTLTNLRSADAYLDGADLSKAYMDLSKIPSEVWEHSAEVHTFCGIPYRIERCDTLTNCLSLRSTRDLRRLARTAIAPQVRIAAYGALLDRYQTYQCIIATLVAAVLAVVLVMS